MAAAIANAVYHATGNRIRSLPITIDKVLGLERLLEACALTRVALSPVRPARDAGGMRSALLD